MLMLFRNATTAIFLSIASQTLAENQRYICSFPTFAQPDGVQSAKDFVLEFNRDTVTGDAFLVGNSGLNQVFAYVGNDGVTFLESLVTGAVQSTTITTSGSAVHSRHSIIVGDLVPSQYYGNCEGP